MWVCMKDGFVSVVQHYEDDNILVVRSRRPEILKNLFEEERITETIDTDYRFRVNCLRDEWKEIMVNRIDDIQYGNFKKSVTDSELNLLYNQFWYLHLQYQEAAYGAAWLSYTSLPVEDWSGYKPNEYTSYEPNNSGLYAVDWPIEAKKPD